MRHITSTLVRSIIAIAIAFVTGLASCGGGVGTCVGTGGALSSPECKEDWTRAECDEWNDQGVNGSTWTYNASNSCSSQGYTEECSDGSWRRPGAC